MGEELLKWRKSARAAESIWLKERAFFVSAMRIGGEAWPCWKELALGGEGLRGVIGDVLILCSSGCCCLGESLRGCGEVAWSWYRVRSKFSARLAAMLLSECDFLLADSGMGDVDESCTVLCP